MASYADTDGHVVVSPDAARFSYRYSTIGFQDTANLDDSDLWPVVVRAQGVAPRGGGEGRQLVQAAIS